jgi:hypothetical protein
MVYLCCPGDLANLALDEFMKRRHDLRSGVRLGQKAPALGQVAIGDLGTA